MIPKLDEFFGKLKEEYSPIIISGVAKGADQYGERYGLEHNIPIERYPADWDTYGKSAGYIRNSIMADIGDVVLVFWDGESKGAKHMFNLAEAKKKPARYINFKLWL